jgi:hypothetical protein
MRTTKFFALIAFALIVITSCRDTEKETVIKEVRVEKEAETEEQEGMLERSAKKVDEEVNKEINEEIEKIGDDN